MEEWYDEDENEPLFHDEYERRVGKLSEDTKDLVDEIEREGIERGKNVAKTADIIIEMIDATNPKRIDFTNMNIKREDGVKIISVVNKSDTLYFLEDEDEAEEEVSCEREGADLRTWGAEHRPSGASSQTE